MVCLKWRNVWIAILAITLSAFAFAEDAYDAGQAAAAERRYDLALASFREAAGQGHRQAQIIAGGMLLYCGRLYGGEVPCDRIEAVKWLKLAAAQGSEMARHLLQHAGTDKGSVTRTAP